MAQLAARRGGAADDDPGHCAKGWLFGFAGVNGKFFGGLPAWVNASARPGYTSQTEFLGWKSTLWQTTTLQYFFFSPNLLWFLSALALWVVFPYDIDAFREGFSMDAFVKRLALNFTYIGVYYVFWFVSLYVFSLASRKFAPNQMPTWYNMAHNIWYWALGVLQCTVWECVMMRLWAAGVSPHMDNATVWQGLAEGGRRDESSSSESADGTLTSKWMPLLVNVAWVLLIPLWRELHFYIAHRFLHIRCCYKYVHALHHRNNDPEPFSGMCMHPVEHLYFVCRSRRMTSAPLAHRTGSFDRAES